MNKTSNLLNVYRDLLNGTSVDVLKQRYNVIDVAVAVELKQRGYTFENVQCFLEERDAHLAKMRRERL